MTRHFLSIFLSLYITSFASFNNSFILIFTNTWTTNFKAYLIPPPITTHKHDLYIEPAKINILVSWYIYYKLTAQTRLNFRVGMLLIKFACSQSLPWYNIIQHLRQCSLALREALFGTLLSRLLSHSHKSKHFLGTVYLRRTPLECRVVWSALPYILADTGLNQYLL